MCTAGDAEVNAGMQLNVQTIPRDVELPVPDIGLNESDQGFLEPDRDTRDQDVVLLKFVIVQPKGRPLHCHDTNLAR